MNHIDELIAQHCPYGVEFKLLGDCIVQNLGGGTPSRSRSEYWDGMIPWASVGDIASAKLTIDAARQTITDTGLDNSSSNVIPRGWVIVAVKISPGEMRVVGRDIAINQDIRGLQLREELDPYFLAYYFQTVNIVGNGTIVKGITNQTLLRISVPVPPLEVQRAIVEVLDTFSALEAELEAELEARKQQYEHYRSDLLASAEENLIVPLHQVAKYSDTRIEASNLDSLTFVGVDNLIADKRGKSEANYLPYTSRLTAYEPGDVLIGNIRPYLKKVWLADSHGGCSGDVLAVRISEDARERLDQAYLYFQLSSDSFFAYNMQHAKGAKMPRGNKQAILNYPIAIPPLEEQRRIVAILDKFDALVNDLSIGLPAELAARRQQYEYYRDKLLAFKEREVAA